MKLAALFLPALLSVPAVGATPRGESALPAGEPTPAGIQRQVILAHLDPAVFAAPIALPEVLAWPGGIGIPRVITWADTTGASGIAWGSTSAITAANASVTYNGTNVVLNAPTAKGFSFNVNASMVNSIDANGAIVFAGNINSQGPLAGTTVYIATSASGDLYLNGKSGRTFGVLLGGAAVGTLTSRLFTAPDQIQFSDPGAVSGHNYFITAATSGKNFIFQDSAGNQFATISDAGTVGSLTVTSSLSLAGSQGSINTVNVTSAVLYFKTSFIFKDDGGNTMMTLTDDGTGATETIVNLTTTGTVVGPVTKANTLLPTVQGNMVFQDFSGNTMATITDGGTTGTFTVTNFVRGGNTVIGNNAVTSGANIYNPTDGGAFAVVEAGSGAALGTFNDLGTTGSLTMSGDGSTGIFGTGTAAQTWTGTLSAQSTAVGNVGGGTDTLQLYDLPANSLVATNRGVKIHAYGTYANNGNGKVLTCLWGSTTILQHSPTINVANERWTMDSTVIRTGASAQDFNTEYSADDGAAGVFAYDPEVGTATETETSAIRISCTGAGTSDNDIVMDGLIVEAF